MHVTVGKNKLVLSLKAKFRNLASTKHYLHLLTKYASCILQYTIMLTAQNSVDCPTAHIQGSTLAQIQSMSRIDNMNMYF